MAGFRAAAAAAVLMRAAAVSRVASATRRCRCGRRSGGGSVMVENVECEGGGVDWEAEGVESKSADTAAEEQL